MVNRWIGFSTVYHVVHHQYKYRENIEETTETHKHLEDKKKQPKHEKIYKTILFYSSHLDRAIVSSYSCINTHQPYTCTRTGTNLKLESDK